MAVLDPQEYQRIMQLQMERTRRDAMERLFYERQAMRGPAAFAQVWRDVEPEPRAHPLEKKLLEALKKAQPRKVGAKVPDSVTPIVAWRAWRTIEQNGEWRLRALGKEAIWEPKKQIEAKCSSGTSHPAPHKDCECGIWCFRSMDTLVKAADTYSSLTVLGTVSIWGRIIECENGFRAQFAYPQELWLLDSSMEQLGYTYGVPVRTA